MRYADPWDESLRLESLLEDDLKAHGAPTGRLASSDRFESPRRGHTGWVMEVTDHRHDHLPVLSRPHAWLAVRPMN